MTTPAPSRQEQAPATDEISEVAPGIYRTQLPVDIPGLGHVNMYLPSWTQDCPEKPTGGL
jgi:hypothetical protein